MTNISAREFCDSFLIQLVSRNDGKSKLLDQIIEARPNKDPDVRVYEVLVSVNGVELDFHDFSDRLSECIDDLIIKAARTIFDEKMNEMTDALFALTENAKSVASAFEMEARRRWEIPSHGGSDE